jgi:hypothetical protein
VSEKKAWRYLDVHPNFKAKIDTEDYGRVSEHSWRATKAASGRLRVVTSIRGPKGVRSLTLGRFLMKPPPSKQVYPRRFNEGLDYRKGNLVVCTVKERQRLLPKVRAKTSSSYRGVSYSKRSDKWRAAIEVDGRTINLGEFTSEQAAAGAYNVGARKHFGDIAYQNRVEDNGNRRAAKKK